MRYSQLLSPGPRERGRAELSFVASSSSRAQLGKGCRETNSLSSQARAIPSAHLLWQVTCTPVVQGADYAPVGEDEGGGRRREGANGRLSDVVQQSWVSKGVGGQSENLCSECAYQLGVVACDADELVQRHSRGRERAKSIV